MGVSLNMARQPCISCGYGAGAAGGDKKSVYMRDVYAISTLLPVMPACAPEFSRLARSNTELVFSPRVKRCSHQQPQFTALRRSFSSTFSLIPEERAVCPERPPALPRIIRLITWGPRLFFRPLSILLGLLLHPAWKQILVVLPTLWIAATLFIFWKLVQCPLIVLKTISSALSFKDSDKPRTVLISGGSTIQALHLARNFHTAGARVVAFEIEGPFSLLKYSAAVNKFYTIPRPNPADPLAYARSLREIVQRESVVFYVPVSSTNSAYYDALAKQYLEVLGCQCFVPCPRDVVTLDDPLEVMRVSKAARLTIPQFWVVTSEEDVRNWYDSDASKEGKHVIASAGARGARDRLRFKMPEEKSQFRFPREISAVKPWVIVREPKGEKIVTCTTLKESRAVNNVSCRYDNEQKGLVAEKDEDVDAAVQRFVSHMTPAKPMTGHVSFRLVREECNTNGHTSKLVVIGARVGVSLPYLCQGANRCGHNSSVPKFLNKVLDTRDALFAFWDPLPYCAYYKAHGEDCIPPPPPPEPCKTPPNVPL